MMLSMTRRAVAGALALAALGATFGFTPGVGTADAAPSVSPFAGSYVGADPLGWSYPWPVTISSRGRITSSFSVSDRKGSIDGRVSADGSCSFTVSVSWVTDEERRGHAGWTNVWTTQSYQTTGSMAPDSDGNIVGTTDTGGSFVWLRQ
jgi:hypothetical protein